MPDIDFATAIAERLSLITGETWSASARRKAGAYTLRADADGAEILIKPAQEHGRVSIVGSFWIEHEDIYDHRPDRSRQHTITIAAGRPPIEIARAIKRRLLPGYRADLAAARRRKAAYDAARSEESATAAELAAIVGGHIARDKHDTFVNGSGGVHITGQVNRGYGVSLELRYLSVDAARRVLAILKDERPVKP
jgi:hypothetical protein